VAVWVSARVSPTRTMAVSSSTTAEQTSRVRMTDSEGLDDCHSAPCPSLTAAARPREEVDRVQRRNEEQVGFSK
jgi:hypothetical protein